MPHYKPDHHPSAQDDVVLPWHVADTAPQPVVNPSDEPPTKNLAGFVSHRGQPKRGFRWGVFLAWLTGGVIVATWLVIVYTIGTHQATPAPAATRTVTETPVARPGPRVTVRIP